MKEKYIYSCKNPECGTIHTVEIQSNETEGTYEDLELYCPLCGAYNSLKRNVPQFMYNVLDILASKGYHVLNVFPKILGLQILELNEDIISQLDNNVLDTLFANEFIIDLEDNDMRLIKNGRMQDSSGFNEYNADEKSQYIVNAITALENFVIELPAVDESVIRSNTVIKL